MILVKISLFRKPIIIININNLFDKVPCVTKDGKPKPNASKVDAYGPGLDPESVFPGKPTNFIVDASRTGEAPVDVSIENSDGSPIENLRKPSIINKGDGIHEVTYVPPPVGDPYEVRIFQI